MATRLNKEIADGIATLVKGQRFSGSGVWRQSGNATLRIENQTKSIVDALSMLPSREEREEEEMEDDRQHTELINALTTGSPTSSTSESVQTKKSGLLGAVGTGMAMGAANIAKTTGSLLTKLNPFKKGGTIAKIFGALVSGAAGIASLLPKGLIGAIRFLFKGLRFLGFGAIGLAIAGFLSFNEDRQKELIDGFFNIVNKVGNFFETITNQFSTEFMKTFEEVGGNEELDRLGKAFNNFTDVLGVQATGLINYVKDIKVSFDGVEYTGDDLLNFFAQVSAKTSKNLISFAAATLEYLADPEMAIKDLKKVVSDSLDEFGFQFKELFSKVSLIRMLESYGLGFLISDNFREGAAVQQRERYEVAGRELPSNVSVATEMEAESFGSFSLPNILKSANQALANYTVRLYDDAGRIIDMTNLAIRDALLPDNLVPVGGGDPALQSVGNVYADNSTNVNKSEVIINDTRTRGESVSGASDSKNRGGK